MPLKIYLAGPDVFLDDAKERLDAKVRLCKLYGAIGISPMDTTYAAQENPSERTSRRIFQGNMDLIRSSDIIIADCNPFRGSPMVDDGTAFELACGYILNKGLYGYADDLSSTEERLKILGGILRDGKVYDARGYAAEPFGNPMNLMLYEAIIERGTFIIGTIEDALKHLMVIGVL